MCFNGAVLSRGRRRGCARRSARRKNASMEPSSAEDGDVFARLVMLLSNCCFNGAVLSRGRRQLSIIAKRRGTGGFNGAVLSRGRRPGAAGNCDAELCPRFNGAVLSRGRRRAKRSGKQSPGPRFNGAVLSRGRRQSQGVSTMPTYAASMEPSSAEDGDAPELLTS